MTGTAAADVRGGAVVVLAVLVRVLVLVLVPLLTSLAAGRPCLRCPAAPASPWCCCTARCSAEAGPG